MLFINAPRFARRRFRESSQDEIDIPDTSYDAFTAMIEYVYTGKSPDFVDRNFFSEEGMGMLNLSEAGGQQDGSGSGSWERERENLSKVVEILILSDQYLLHHLKQETEKILSDCICESTHEYLLGASESCNAMQLYRAVHHFRRNRDGI